MWFAESRPSPQSRAQQRNSTVVTSAPVSWGWGPLTCAHTCTRAGLCPPDHCSLLAHSPVGPFLWVSEQSQQISRSQLAGVSLIRTTSPGVP